MKHLILLLAALLPALAFAAEKNDTTFTVKDKTIVIDVDSGKTVVKVYNKDGYQLSKTRIRRLSAHSVGELAEHELPSALPYGVVRYELPQQRGVQQRYGRPA